MNRACNKMTISKIEMSESMKSTQRKNWSQIGEAKTEPAAILLSMLSVAFYRVARRPRRAKLTTSQRSARGRGQGSAAQSVKHPRNRIGVSALPGSQRVRKGFRLHQESGCELGNTRAARAASRRSRSARATAATGGGPGVSAGAASRMLRARKRNSPEPNRLTTSLISPSHEWQTCRKRGPNW